VSSLPAQARQPLTPYFRESTAALQRQLHHSQHHARANLEVWTAHGCGLSGWLNRPILIAIPARHHQETYHAKQAHACERRCWPACSFSVLYNEHHQDALNPHSLSSLIPSLAAFAVIYCRYSVFLKTYAPYLSLITLIFRRPRRDHIGKHEKLQLEEPFGYVSGTLCSKNKCADRHTVGSGRSSGWAEKPHNFQRFNTGMWCRFKSGNHRTHVLICVLQQKYPEILLQLPSTQGVTVCIPSRKCAGNSIARNWS
jgi:hypothetical protein